MNLPADFPFLNDLSVITAKVEHYSSTTASTTIQGYDVVYYHIPFFVWFVLAISIIWILNRLIIEFIIRLRKE